MKKLVPISSSSNQILQKKDIHELSQKIDRNQKALDILVTYEDSLKFIEPTFKILKENEENLKNLGTLKQRLDTLDKIMVTVDKIAGSIQTYQQEQALLSSKVSDHTDDIEKLDIRVIAVEKRLQTWQLAAFNIL